MRKREKKGSWVVRVRCTVVKELVVENCTAEEANRDPWECDVTDEVEKYQEDWEVLAVNPNV